MIEEMDMNMSVNMENVEPNKAEEVEQELSSGMTSNEQSAKRKIESIGEGEQDSGKLDKIFHTAEEQRELFLWKYTDVSVSEVNKMYNVREGGTCFSVCRILTPDLFFTLQQFKAADVYNRGELTEHEAMMMFEKRGSSKTAGELRQLVSNFDKDRSFRLSLSEWLCSYFKKSYEQLTLSDRAARRKALAEAKAAREEAARLEESIRQAQEEWEHRSSIRAAALEQEARQVGLTQQFKRRRHFSYQV